MYVVVFIVIRDPKGLAFSIMLGDLNGPVQSFPAFHYFFIPAVKSIIIFRKYVLPSND